MGFYQPGSASCSRCFPDHIKCAVHISVHQSCVLAVTHCPAVGHPYRGNPVWSLPTVPREQQSLVTSAFVPAYTAVLWMFGVLLKMNSYKGFRIQVLRIPEHTVQLIPANRNPVTIFAAVLSDWSCQVLVEQIGVIYRPNGLWVVWTKELWMVWKTEPQVVCLSRQLQAVPGGSAHTWTPPGCSAGQSALLLWILEGRIMKPRWEGCIRTIRSECSQYFLYDVAILPISSKGT